MHHYECVAPNVDINLQSGRFWATRIAWFRERFTDFSRLHPCSMGASRWSPVLQGGSCLASDGNV